VIDLENVVQVGYVAAAILFVLALKWLSHPSTARRGVKAGELGMLVAVVGTLLKAEIVSYDGSWSPSSPVRPSGCRWPCSCP
jgi:NAD(P) transhydrogenase subunit beta